MIEDILDMMKQNATISEEQLQMVSKNPEMKESCRDILYARRIYRKQNMIDVETQLAAFKKKHQSSQKRRLRIITVTVATAAVLISAILLLLRQNSPQTNLSIWTNHIGKDTPVLMVANGQKVPIRIVHQKQLVDPEVFITPDAGIEIRDTLVLNVPNGRTYQIVLPDGSRVYLHPGSRLAYPSRFYGTTRKVKLSGEAYFIIAKDRNHPFIVTTNRSQTQVLGTEFDITSYAGQPETVTLIAGSIAFKPATLQDTIIITPGQQVTIDTAGKPLISSIDTDPYTMWRDGYFYFDQKQLRDVLTELGRYYDVNITSYNQKALSCRVRFICKRDADLHTVTNNINLMKICNASIEKDKIVIR